MSLLIAADECIDTSDKEIMTTCLWLSVGELGPDEDCRYP